jgi:hypothetical protein
VVIIQCGTIICALYARAFVIALQYSAVAHAPHVRHAPLPPHSPHRPHTHTREPFRLRTFSLASRGLAVRSSLARSSGSRCSFFSFLVVDLTFFGSFPMCRKCDFSDSTNGIGTAPERNADALSTVTRKASRAFSLCQLFLIRDPCAMLSQFRILSLGNQFAHALYA